MKCKNIECENDTIGKRIYCSLVCRNYYVNKYLRDYSKNKEAILNSYKEKYIPNKCKFQSCNNDISYENRESEYCSRECSKKMINVNRKELGLKYNLSQETLIRLKRSAIENFSKINYNDYLKRIEEYLLSPKKCKNCDILLEYCKKDNTFCSKECYKYNRRKNSDIYKSYKNYCKFRFNLADYPDEFDFSLIRENGWYSPTNKKNNLGGVSRDHMLSVKEGFELGIDPKLLAHPANCKLMIHTENISKNKKSSITLEELLERIENFKI